MRIKICSIITITFIIGGFIIMETAKVSYRSSQKKPVRVLLLGASVGQAWNLPEWPTRVHNNDYVMETIAEYSFDKSNALEEILMRPERKFHLTRAYIKSLFKQAPQKPNIIIIKECAAYFPGDLGKNKELVKKWVNQCKAAAIKPVLATVVPVTEEHSLKIPGRLQGILEYNDWIRQYTRENGIVCLDLEAALRISKDDRRLRPDLTSGDGLHLNRKAYDILDKLQLNELSKVI
ncbi:MAG: hypothetical protein NTW64_00640 [Candidatus Omnitrophica bacterium]|nr:hypothetical protein [Candidatus Omnitrophota bacterium]